MGGLGSIGDKIQSSGIGSMIPGMDSMMVGQREAYENRAQFERNVALQKEFAQKGIQWKVADGRAAGINPLVALGASTMSFSPVSVGNTDPYLGIMKGAKGEKDKGLNMLGNMVGGNYMSSTQTREQQEASQLNLASMKLDNEIKATQLRQMNSGPNFPSNDNFIEGQGNSGPRSRSVPAQNTMSHRERSAQEAGWSPDVGYARTDTGLVPVPSKDVKERIEDQMIPEAMWAMRNYLVPNLSGGSSGAPPKSMLPKGADYWSWSYSKQEWQPAKGRPGYRSTDNSFLNK